MILQLIESALVGGAAASGALLVIKNKLNSRTYISKHDGTLSWSIYQICSKTDHWGFRCPKCDNIYQNPEHGPLCQCMEYHREHFHFKCNDCGYQNILRT